jgi:hypothetical protein
VLAGDGIVGILEGTEQERNVLALTDAIIHPAGVFNPIVHICFDSFSSNTV